MPSILNPYLSFKDNAREAMEFYHWVFGGELTINTFGDFGMSQNPDEATKVMHSQLKAPNGMVLMGSDTPEHMPLRQGSSITVSLSGDDDAELSGYFAKLGQGGQVDMPLAKAPWFNSFGMLTDRFGITWMVNIAGTPPVAA